MKKKILFLTIAAAVLTFALTLSSCGPSAAQLAILSAPSVNELDDLNAKLYWIVKKAESGDVFDLVLEKDETINNEAFSGCGDGCGHLYVKGNSGVTVTLRGSGGERVIRGKRLGHIFEIGPGVALILSENITVKGPGGITKKDREMTLSDPLIRVMFGGKLVMEDGSKITEGANFNHKMNGKGGGVGVLTGGAFVMKGGVISDNKCFNEAGDAGGDCLGGGVFVDGGEFIKAGGTITGYDDDNEHGNVAWVDGRKKDWQDSEGKWWGAAGGKGHAIFFHSLTNRISIDKTVGPGERFHYKSGKLSQR